MIDTADLQLPNFDLNEMEPVQMMINNHLELDDHYFDMHYQFEVGILLSGQMKREYFDHRQELEPGDVWLCGMWEPHGYELIETPCEVAVFIIDPTYIANNQLLNENILKPFQVAPQLRPRANDNNRHSLIELAQKTRTIVDNSTNPDWAKLQLFQLLLILVEGWDAPHFEGNYFSFRKVFNPH